MLVLTRRLSERIFIEGGITIVVVELTGDHVRIGIDAPPEVEIMREEVAVSRRLSAEGGAIGPNEVKRRLARDREINKGRRCATCSRELIWCRCPPPV